MKNTDPLFMIIPVEFEADWPTKESVLSCIREQNRLYGFQHFALEFPYGGWRSSTVYPSKEYFQEKASLFREIREELAPEGIRCGWWITLTFKNGAIPGWQKIVRADGTEIPYASCSMDPGFRSAFFDRIALFAKTARPEFILTEDDFCYHFGCFCERHLTEFNRKVSGSYTRETLTAAMGKDTPEAKDLKSRWQLHLRDTLEDFASGMRAALDRETPEIPMGSCQCGSWNWEDGDATETISRALAGPRHRPFSRLYGAFYGGEDILSLPGALLNSLYHKQSLPKDFICLHESDTFPHTRFFTSAASIRIVMSTIYSQGFDGSLFQTQQLLDDPNEEAAYGQMFAEERSRFQAMHDASKQCSLKGVSLPFFPREGAASDWTRCISHFGIPYTSLEAPVTCLSGDQAKLLKEDALMGLFRKGLLLDGEAAKVLFERGYGEYIGTDVGPDAVSGLEKFDLAGREVIESKFLSGRAGRNMHLAGFYAPHGNGASYNLIPHPGAEILTRLFTFQKREIGIGMTRFINKLGGRVVVMGMSTTGNQSSSLFNYRRQRLIQDQLVWLGAQTAFVRNDPRVFLVMNEADDPADAGFFGMLTISNLNPDPMDGISLYLPESWRKAKRILRLDREGAWRPFEFETETDGIRLPLRLDYARPEVFLFA